MAGTLEVLGSITAVEMGRLFMLKNHEDLIFLWLVYGGPMYVHF